MTLRQILSDLPDIRLASFSGGRGGDFNIVLRDELETNVDAPLVEESEFRLHDVADLGKSGFTHFLDGVQRPWPPVAYDGFTPILLAHTSAALLERKDKAMLAPDDATWARSLDFYVPGLRPELKRKLDDMLNAAWQGQPALFGESKVFDVKKGDGASDIEIQANIQKAIERQRMKHEEALASGFGDGRLLIDGGLGEIPRLNPGAFVVGLVKSHRKHHFHSQQRADVMLSMQVGQRTTVFLREPSRVQGPGAYSFYLKMHGGEHASPLFGLARIEMPEDERYLQIADRIAAWILHERSPLSLPDHRYDVLIYPIHLVEEHLRARMPSEAAIRGLIGI